MKISKLGVIVFALVILLSSIAGCSNTPSTTNPTVAFSTYTESTNLYSISYPQTWELANSMVTLQNQITATINKIKPAHPLLRGV